MLKIIWLKECQCNVPFISVLLPKIISVIIKAAKSSSALMKPKS